MLTLSIATLEFSVMKRIPREDPRTNGSLIKILVSLLKPLEQKMVVRFMSPKKKLISKLS